MTAELNRQRVLNMFEMFYAGDVEGALARCTDDVEFFSNAPIDIIPHLGGHRGIPALRGMWETVHQRYKDTRYEIQSMVAEDDKVAVLTRLFFRKRSNDRTIQFDLAIFFTLRSGKIAHIREVIDTFDLVEQVLERDLSALLTGKQVGDT